MAPRCFGVRLRLAALLKLPDIMNRSKHITISLKGKVPVVLLRMFLSLLIVIRNQPDYTSLGTWRPQGQNTRWLTICPMTRLRLLSGKILSPIMNWKTTHWFDKGWLWHHWKWCWLWVNKDGACWPTKMACWATLCQLAVVLILWLVRYQWIIEDSSWKNHYQWRLCKLYPDYWRYLQVFTNRFAELKYKLL